MEKFYSSKALLKMAVGGMHPSHPPGSAPGVACSLPILSAKLATVQEKILFKKACHI